jgi:cation diffusion facilitator CzcD-associated flavoprotein CzcO
MSEAAAPVRTLDALIVGAGFAGLYQLLRLRRAGFTAQVIEAGDNVGGTWYWNRYPGARCDIESLEYQYGFDEALAHEWQWSERYATQPEILRYINWVADRFDLREDVRFETRVTSAHFNEATNRWLVTTDRGDSYSARFCIMATGCLSAARVPDFKGLDSYKGEWYHTGEWPHEGVDFAGKTVGVIGTGSSAIQSIPLIAAQAKNLTVFQRTANFSVPAHNGPIDESYKAKILQDYTAFRRAARASQGGVVRAPAEKSALEATPEERQREFEIRWEIGGFAIGGAFIDLAINEEANATAAEFVRSKIRQTVKDPATAELLCPRDYPFATKRLCVDTGYFETFNRDNVSLVDVKNNPVAEITTAGLKLQDGTAYDFDAIVFATGFDAMTGALSKIDIQGRGGLKLNEKWEHGPRTYLGLQAAGFPNLFTITGPGSPSVLSNMIVSIEQHVDWITDCLEYLRDHGTATIEATTRTEDEWVDHVNTVASFTLYPKANSWYLGANVPGKPRVFMPYIGGVGNYAQKCDQVAKDGYEGFALDAKEPVSAR